MKLSKKEQEKFIKKHILLFNKLDVEVKFIIVGPGLPSKLIKLIDDKKVRIIIDYTFDDLQISFSPGNQISNIIKSDIRELQLNKLL
jgi:hypothetical protein